MKTQIYLIMIGVLIHTSTQGQSSEEAIKYRLSTVAGINFSNAAHFISDAANSSYDQTFTSRSLAFKPTLDYFFTPKLGAGISFTYFQHELLAHSLVGVAHDDGLLGLFVGNIYYYDEVNLKTAVNMLSSHVAYKLSQYNRGRGQLWEITARAGFSTSFIKEEQILTVSQGKERPGGFGYYYSQRKAFNDFKKVAFSGFLNLQLAVHINKYFSFIIADLTANFGVSNPAIPQTTVTDGNKTVTAYRHKTTASGFTLATGLSVSF